MELGGFPAARPRFSRHADGGPSVMVTRTGGHSTSTVAGVRNTNLNFVTATQIDIPGFAKLASFGTLSLQLRQPIVPEPGTLTLLAAGLVSLGALARRRRKA